MPAPYSNDLRLKVLDAYQNGDETIETVAQRFSVSGSFVKNLMKRYQETGQVVPDKMGGNVLPKVSVEGTLKIKEWLAETSDLTLTELCVLYENEYSVILSITSMGRALKRANITRKKKATYDPKKDTELVQEYKETLTSILDQEHIYIDEMGANLDLTRTYARSEKGTRAYGEKPTARGKRISTVGALSEQGMVTAMCFEGTMNTAVFMHFLEFFLCPLLKPGQWVILDNASPHKAEDVRHTIEKTGAKLLYLPPYSPEYNPIEQVWSKVKSLLRSAKARTVEKLYDELAIALNKITKSDAQGFFKHLRKLVLT